MRCPAAASRALKTANVVAPPAARQASPWFGPSRPQLPAAVGGCQPHLSGAVAGDYGFDPLGLSREPEAFRRNHEAELLHARCVGGLVQMTGACSCCPCRPGGRLGTDTGSWSC